MAILDNLFIRTIIESLLLTLIISSGLFYFISHANYHERPEIILHNLSVEESTRIIEIMYDLKSEYFHTIGKVEFYNNQSDVRSLCGLEDEAALSGGCNFLSGRRIIVWTGRTDYELRWILCHEILHSIVESYDEETFVRNLDDSLNCYNLGGYSGKSSRVVIE